MNGDPETVVVRHGTVNAYQNLGCRCRPCTTAWATYVRERRAVRRADPPDGD